MKANRTKPITAEEGLKKGEKEFYMSLPLTVSGLNVRGEEFKEHSVLLSISSQEATLILAAPVNTEAFLKLTMTLPSKLSDGKPLYLILKGTVKEVQTLSGHNGAQKIRLHLDSRYVISEGKT